MKLTKKEAMNKIEELKEYASDYSTVLCLKCTGCGRTKAKYVDELEDENNSKNWVYNGDEE